jgi:hypothetical protein
MWELASEFPYNNPPSQPSLIAAKIPFSIISLLRYYGTQDCFIKNK